LLEHQFRIAPEQYAAVAEDGGQVWKPATEVSVADAVETVPEAGLYVVNDEGERKATGAYYTPDYVVTYIVEETVGPLVKEIREDLIDQGFEPGTQEYIGPFFRRVTDLRILDPAMGSGHFLTKATGYLSEQVMAEVREAESEFGVAFDEQHIRREIAKECIYGVDLNGMAVELAKLSMWLETLAADRPLAFLDHHFKQGNSLVGSDIEAIEELESDTNGDNEQASLAEFGATREGTIERLMDIYSEFLAIENEGIDDVREMKRKYEEIEQDDLRNRLVSMANVHTAERFGLDVPGGAYERIAQALENDEEWDAVTEADWFTTAQVMAAERDFFHWRLEFPEVFYGEGGTLREDSGVDAVIGNPPYVRQEQLSASKNYFQSEYKVYHSVADLYAYFVENGKRLLRSGGQFGYIISNKFTKAEYGENLRNLLSQETTLRTILDFDDLPVFSPSVSAYPMILVFENALTDENTVSVTRAEDLTFSDLQTEVADRSYPVEQELFSAEQWLISHPAVPKIVSRMKESGIPLFESIETSDSADIRYGVKTGLNEAFFIDSEVRDRIFSRNADSDQFIHPLIVGEDINRYAVDFSDRYLIAVPSGWTFTNSPYASEDEAWEWFEKEFPGIADHLREYEKDARARHDRGECWWELRPCDYYDVLKNEKIVYPIIASEPRFAYDFQGRYMNDKCFAIPADKRLIGILNSTLSEFWCENTLSTLRGGYQEFRRIHIREFPVATSDNEIRDLVGEMISLIKDRHDLNLSLLDYIQPYIEEPTVSDVGIYQPPEGVGDTKLAATNEDYENIRVGTVTCVRQDENTVIIHATARYKPDDDDAYETDQWGYTETEPMPAMRLTDLTEIEADLVESFVPVAVEEAGGFAGFRETATKTNSLIDRLEAITLPDPDDVAEDLERYRDAVERAEELDEEIERTDDLIDEIVYDLYELTDEEIEIVEEAVADD
jgi:hypothetical protein